MDDATTPRHHSPFFRGTELDSETQANLDALKKDLIGLVSQPSIQHLDLLRQNVNEIASTGSRSSVRILGDVLTFILEQSTVGAEAKAAPGTADSAKIVVKGLSDLRDNLALQGDAVGVDMIDGRFKAVDVILCLNNLKSLIR